MADLTRVKNFDGDPSLLLTQPYFWSGVLGKIDPAVAHESSKTWQCAKPSHITSHYVTQWREEKQKAW